MSRANAGISDVSRDQRQEPTSAKMADISNNSRRQRQQPTSATTADISHKQKEPTSAIMHG
jgi:hypothetical protein